MFPLKTPLAFFLAALAAAPALAAGTVPLTGGREAIFRHGASAARDRARIDFAIDPPLANLPDPRCPAASFLHLGTDDLRRAAIALPCANWTRTGKGYRYSDPRGSAGGVRTIALYPERLFVRLEGESYDAVSGPVGFVEAYLAVGPTSYCGRFTALGRNQPGLVAARGPTGSCRPRPNVILVNLDDTRADGIDRMPVLQSRLIGEGARFEYSFTPNPLCCPSRASILTGLYSLHHGVRTMAVPLGGASRFRETGADRRTIATSLRAAGYRTGLFGKYLNGYDDSSEGEKGTDGTFYLPPGWSRWWAFVNVPHYGGVHGKTYEVIEENGRRTVYRDHATDDQYVTDLSARRLRSFIAASVAAGEPFFAYWAPTASHVETPGFYPAPAARHFDALAGLPPLRPPSWNEEDVSDKPRWIRAAKDDPLGGAFTDSIRQRAYETLLAVDEQLAEVLDLLTSLGVSEDTLVLFTSDNGVAWGEHRLFVQLKGCPYEECQRVPMIARYPRLAGESPTTVRAPVLNIDVAPTIAALARVEEQGAPDGKSFAPWIAGAAPREWRTDYLIECWQDSRNDRLAYSGQPADGDRLRLFHGPRELPDPQSSVLFEFDAAGGVVPGAIPVAIGASAKESFANLAAAVRSNVAGAVAVQQRAKSRLVVRDASRGHDGLYWWEEVDQSGAFEPDYRRPDYLGVRDVENGFTWVEYATGEKELYDLNADPFELENRADDPAYGEARQRLQDRLRQLLSQRHP